MRIDGDEQAPAAGQHFVFGIQNLGHVDVAATANAHLARFDAQRLVEWDRLKVVHGDLRGQRDYVAQLIYLAHRVVKDGSDHASVDAVGKMKQFATYFTHGVRNGSKLRADIYHAHEKQEIIGLVDAFFERELSVAAEI